MPVVLMASPAPGSGSRPGSGVSFPAHGKFGSFKTCFVLGDLNKTGLVGDVCRVRLEVLCLQIPRVCFHPRQNLFLVSYIVLINLFLFSSLHPPVPHWQQASAAGLPAAARYVFKKSLRAAAKQHGLGWLIILSRSKRVLFAL